MKRRTFMSTGIIAASGLATSWLWWNRGNENGMKASVFVAKARDYETELTGIMRTGFKELGLTESEIKGKSILLKPNLVEPHEDARQINTHPRIVVAAAEAFRSLGASAVTIGEAPGHRRDSLLVLDEAGYVPYMLEHKLPFVDLNHDAFTVEQNLGNRSKLEELVFPRTVRKVDLVVSIAKMKTHHWAGVTLSMKNLFGVMPGIVYGWPKNPLHHAGIIESILDITATLQPHFAIVDGIVGMEGDGPIMGTAKEMGVIAMSRNLPALDATCCRLMAIDPHNIPYLKTASGWLGPIRDGNIEQRGETIASLQSPFLLLEDLIPAHKGIRLKS